MSLGCDVARELIRRRPELSSTLLGEIGTIVSTACLAHDMGNPPFGHSGEKAIQTFFTEGQGAYLQDLLTAELWSDLTHFEGNANAFRLLAHRFKGRREGGFVMTYTTLASIVKYPCQSGAAGRKGKFGFFYDDREIYLRIARELGIPQLSPGDCSDPFTPVAFARHPLVYLVEAADDICYEIMDIEDAHKLKLLSFDETSSLLLGFFDDDTQRHILQRIVDEGITDDNEKVIYMRACVIGKLENLCAAAFVENEAAILSGTFARSLIDVIPPMQHNAYRRCQQLSAKNLQQQARSRHRAVGLQDYGDADGAHDRGCDVPRPLLFATAHTARLLAVRHPVARPRDASPRRHRLYLGHDRHLRPRRISENQRNIPAHRLMAQGYFFVLFTTAGSLTLSASSPPGCRV